MILSLDGGGSGEESSSSSPTCLRFALVLLALLLLVTVLPLLLVREALLSDCGLEIGLGLGKRRSIFSRPPG